MAHGKNFKSACFSFNTLAIFLLCVVFLFLTIANLFYIPRKIHPVYHDHKHADFCDFLIVSWHFCPCFYFSVGHGTFVYWKMTMLRNFDPLTWHCSNFSIHALCQFLSKSFLFNLIWPFLCFFHNIMAKFPHSIMKCARTSWKIMNFSAIYFFSWLYGSFVH